MDIDPRKLTVLLAVHRAGGVLAAADHLHLTPSAVSQQIARLEDAIGTAVLDRQPGGAVVTPAGRVLAEVAERIEGELTDARKALAALNEDVTGTVVIGAFQTIIGAVLVPMLHRLREELPGVEVVILEVDPEDGQQRLRSGGVDLLTLEADSPVGRRTSRGTRDVPILEEPWMALVPATMPTPTGTADLEHLPWLGVDDGSAAHPATYRARRSLATDPATVHSYENYNVARSMVAGGLGIAIVPALATREDLGEATKAVSLPGLGTRRLIARHRTTRSEPRAEVLAVLDAMIAVAAELE
ncbi:LysR family transcriptional regulator [Amycolatopsis lurida]